MAVWMRSAPPTGPRIRTLGPWLVALFGEDAEPLGRVLKKDITE